jgi:hypothetical protein
MASNGTHLVVKWPDAPAQIYRSGNDYLYDAAAFTRTPGGHPEGYLRLLPIYTRILTLFANLQGEKPTAEMLDFPMLQMELGNGFY